MMIFTGGEWADKINFVDENNVLVGYDMCQDCCEDADWFISEQMHKETDGVYLHKHGRGTKLTAEDLKPYVFEPNFFVGIEDSELDSGGMVAFRLVAKGKPDLFLHLFNAHNGYYGHGFEVKISGETIHKDTL